jgi:predicted dehydrogenase/nucleoside-diphosphate-sugar epimerase
MTASLDRPRDETRVSAPMTARLDRPLDVGLLGTGYIADWHAQALRAVRGVRLAAACDRDPGRVHAFAARHGIARVSTSLGAMLSQGRLDAIHVLLPPDGHAQAAGEIIDAGIPVLLEKPMATSVEACARLIERARSKGIKLGVSHNFLFAPIYERLKQDLASGRLGRPDEITITWNKGLDVLQAGPFDLWMLREPQNILLEIGSHSVAHLLDLAGPAEVLGVQATNPMDLPGGARFFRRWRVEAGPGSVGVTLSFSFAPGFTEHSIHVRGSLASATVDFERNIYLRHRHTPSGLDLDRYHMTVSEAKALERQARGTLSRVVASKLLSTGGTPYGQSIARALQSFYARPADSTDPQLSPELGRDVVRLCVEIGRMAGVESARPARGANGPASPAAPSGSPARPEILILGATGFIGRELARQLLDRGHAIRVLVRNPSRLPPDLRGPRVDVVVGDLSRDAGLVPALIGIQGVYHLARPHVKTWEEYAEHEVEATRRVAEACLAAQVGRLIYTGTIDSYYGGGKAGIITEDTPLDPHIGWRNYYARAKALSERTLRELHRDQGLPVVIVRPGVVIGRGSSPLHWGIGMWSYDAVCQVWGRGRSPLPLVLVEDVAAALVAARVAPGIEGECFNLVADSGLTALEYLEALEGCSGVEFQKIPTPLWKFYLADVAKWLVKRAIRHPDRRRPSYRDWESRTLRARYDCSKARRLLNWNPTSARTEIIRRGIEEPARELLAGDPPPGGRTVRAAGRARVPSPSPIN